MPQETSVTNNLRQTLRAGITGGIGSGKSLVSRMFMALGAPVYDADTWARWLIGNDLELKTGIVKIFGPAAYSPEGVYDRTYVARLAFADPEKLAALNALVHPAVEQHSRAWHEEQAARGCPYTLKEAALMVESGSHRFLDFLIVVTAPESLRIRRVMQRDGLTEEQVRARIAGQLPEPDKVKLADFIVVNDGVQMLIPQVWRLHRFLLEKAGAL
ncbi:MAG: dephospho-CoA kinase [Lewinellaceae bacterium]|nr:dephospho-CoA kinase [Lewinellaceae bacterium]